MIPEGLYTYLTKMTPIILLVCSDSHELTEGFIKKNFFRFPPTTVPEVLEITVKVDGLEHPVRVIHENTMTITTGKYYDMVVSITGKSGSIWSLCIPEERRRLPRILLGGLPPENLENLPNTSWRSEVEEGWLENLVARHLHVATERQVYSSQMEKFMEYIAYVEAFIKAQNISRPRCPEDLTSESFSRETPAIPEGVFVNREHPVFRKLFESKFGMDSPYRKEMGYILSISKKWLTLYFVTQE